MKFFNTTLILFSTFGAFACDMCGNFMGITPYDNQSQLTLLHRYRVFNGYRNYQQRSVFFIPGAYKMQHDPSTNPTDSVVEITHHSAKDYESYKVIELRAKYFLHPRLEFNMILPLQQIKTSYNGIKRTNTGVADPSVFLAYHLLKRLNEYKLRQRLIIGVGLKCPFGNDGVTDTKNNRLFLLTQNGTGSWDNFYYLNYILSVEHIGFSANTMFKWNGKNAYQEKLGNSFTQAISVFGRLELKQLRIFPAVLANYEFTKGLYLNKKLVQNTNMNLLMMGPSMDVNYKNVVLNMCYQFNAFERVSSQQLSASGRLIIGLTWNFTQRKYLINS